MHWTDRLQETTGWNGPRRECDWTALESALGTSLPTDWKELFVRFGPGSFSSYVFALQNGEGMDSVLHHWRTLRRKSQEDPGWMARYFTPFRLYDPTEGSGLIMWGRSETGGRFYWLADSSADPATWPVVARPMWGEPWHRLGISASEFICRAIADPGFQPFTVADPRHPPSFCPDPAETDQAAGHRS